MNRTDILIVGGGISGLTLALELTLKQPGVQITIVERTTWPAPEITHKVGESTVEIGAHYLRDVLGLGNHLRRVQLPKYGLRVFYSDRDNQDITQRPELGHSVEPPDGVGTFQIDRGRLENALHHRLETSANVTILDRTRVVSIDLGEDDQPHTAILTGQHAGTVVARWVVDSTGRARLLKRKFDLTKSTGHSANAAWFRVAGFVDVDDWSTNPDWHARIRECRRGLSTNHLMGTGYWVWIIPLASHATSIGIVSDANLHDFEEMNSKDKALAWLARHEPQLASQLNCREHLDFRLMTNYSYSAAQVFSSQRWALTGDAGVFLDPLYSPGLDLIAISNSLVCDLVEMDREGKDLEEYAAIHNRIFMLIVEGWSKIYSGQYVVMGSARAMTAKIVWDTAAYWAVPGLLYFQDHLRLICGFPQILTAMARLSSINEHAQRLFREWAALELDQRTQRPVFASLYDYDFMPGLHAGMTRQLAGEELAAKISENVDLLENLVGQLADVLISECQTLGGAAADQAQAWAAEPQIAALRERYLDLPANHVPADNWLHFAEPALSDAECSPVEGKTL